MRVGLAAIGLSLVVAACGDSGTLITTTQPPPTSEAPTSTAPPATEAPDSTTTTVPPGASLAEIRQATIRVVARGTFVDPYSGVQANVPGSGSGFIIDPSGIAVTNNHVVTGAGILTVYVGDETEPRNARVIGVSECSDIAVLDINGEGFTALDWYDGDITAGLEVLASGFPLGDPEYTLLDGIVSKEDADGETSWASVDYVIEHTADTLPGNSGGPIVTKDGLVLGVNYAGNGVGQAFAIGAPLARPTVEQIVANASDVDSIGVNGEAISDVDFFGIWVYSVESGSLAEAAGIAGGDLILAMEGIDVGDDGTMAAYCDVLRSHAPTDTLAVDVYRAADAGLYSGQINGTSLEFVTSLDGGGEGDGLGGTVVRAVLPAAEAYFDYTEFTDDSGAITVTAPTAWSDVLGEPWRYGGVSNVGPALSAATDRQAWLDGWATPGLFIAASTELGLSPVELLADQDFSGSCTYAGTEDYNDGYYVGLMDVWQDCGSAGSEFLVVAAQPPDGSYIVLVQIIEVTDADVGAADQIFLSFFVTEPAAG
jgi:serine protease Do